MRCEMAQLAHRPLLSLAQSDRNGHVTFLRALRRFRQDVVRDRCCSRANRKKSQGKSCRLSTRKGGVLLHLNHIATASTRWRGRNLFEMNRLAAEIHQNRRLRTAPGEPSAVSTTRRHGAKE